MPFKRHAGIECRHPYEVNEQVYNAVAELINKF